MEVWPKQKDAIAFYGDPSTQNGEASADWAMDNLVYVQAPWQLVTSWDGKPMGKGVRVHKKCAASLQRVFAAIWQQAGENQSTIKDWGMNLCGGGYTFKHMTSSDALSMHAYGCAVDFDPARNQYGDTTPNFGGVAEVLKAFADEGWVWGGNWKKPDGMHWQAAMV